MDSSMMQDKVEEVEFTPPDGVIPKGTKSGDQFDVKAVLELQDDGSVEIVSINGVAMTDPDESTDETTETDNADYAGTVAKGVFGDEGAQP